MHKLRKLGGALVLLGVLSSVLLGCVAQSGREPLTEQRPSLAPEQFGNLEPIQPDAELSLRAEEDWYKDAVFYHVWVNAFHDSDGSGFGDIRGITEKLDYLRELGVTALWLSPFFESASTTANLHMYDTTDHYRVDPRVGTNEDVEELLAEAHARGMRLIFDWVPNHVSVEHPWFSDSATRRNDRRDWFVWRERPASQSGPWGQSVWHERYGAYYYGVFWNGMPDLNFHNQAAKDAITNAAIYWLNKGFDGMRIDAVKYLYEDPRGVQGGYDDQPESKAYFRAFREQILDEYGELGYGKFMVAENWTNDRESLESFMHSQGEPGFQMTLDFPFATAAAGRNATSLTRHWLWATGELAENGWFGTFLSNHDNVVNRPASLQPTTELHKAVVALQLTGPGTPFLYYGNEIGMPDQPQQSSQGHEDMRHRRPFDWTRVAAMDADDNSLLNWHRDLTELRHSRSSLRRGDFSRVDDASSTAFAFQRWLADDSEGTLVVLNIGTSTASITVPDSDKIGEVLWTSPDFPLGTGSLDLPSGAVGVFALTDRLPETELVEASGEVFHLRGDFNAWGATPMTRSGSGDAARWTSIEPVRLRAGSAVQFKFTFSEDPASWDDLTLGHGQVSYVQLPGSVALEPSDFSAGDYENIVFSIEETGNYFFVVLEGEPRSGSPVRWTLVPEE